MHSDLSSNARVKGYHHNVLHKTVFYELIMRKYRYRKADTCGYQPSVKIHAFYDVNSYTTLGQLILSAFVVVQ